MRSNITIFSIEFHTKEKKGYRKDEIRQHYSAKGPKVPACGHGGYSRIVSVMSED